MILYSDTHKKVTTMSYADTDEYKRELQKLRANIATHIAGVVTFEGIVHKEILENLTNTWSPQPCTNQPTERYGLSSNVYVINGMRVQITTGHFLGAFTQVSIQQIG